MSGFDWHSGEITRATPITKSYRSTQKVRHFFKAECGDGFKFDRSFREWLKAAAGKTLADAVDEWRRRQPINDNSRPIVELRNPEAAHVSP